MSKLTKFKEKLNNMSADALAEVTTMINCPTAEDKAVIGSSAAFGAIMGGTMLVFAEEDDDIFSRSTEMLGDIFGKLVAISTAIAVVMLIIVGILYMISSDPQSAQMAKKRAFRIIIAWILCNIISSIVKIIGDLTDNSNVSDTWETVVGQE